MKKVFLVSLLLLVFSCCLAETNPEFFTPQELNGTWHNQKWPEALRRAFNFIDLGEQDYETMYFADGKYMLLGSDDHYLDKDDLKIFSFSAYKLINDDPKVQWIGFYTFPNWLYVGIAKVTQDTAMKKEWEGKTVLDLEPGDMILTYYSNKGKILYRRQFRKVGN